MSLKESLIAELQLEAVATRKMLERVPEDKLTWTPHDKSMKLGRLASHIAENPLWVYSILDNDEVDFANFKYEAADEPTIKGLLKLNDDMLSKAIESLKNTSDETLMKDWTMRNGDEIYMTIPKIAALRMLAFSHFIHHRAQLGVYLRLLDVSVPSVYGPSADENVM